jgi:hypothetical protein
MARFNPTFPIIHEATLVLKDCGPFLLLNMVAIGSLFIGRSEAIAKVRHHIDIPSIMKFDSS